MKKIYFIFIIIIALFLCSCKADLSSSNSIREKSTFTVIKENKNFRVDYLGQTTNEHPKYHYSIFNNDGEVMFEDEMDVKYPAFDYLNDDILRMTIGAGNLSIYQFFDVKENRISPQYNNPKLIENNKIVYMNFDGTKIKLIVSDLFDKLKFYKEYERDFSPVAAPYNDLISAKFIDSNRLQITYLSGSDFKEVTETIELN